MQKKAGLSSNRQPGNRFQRRYGPQLPYAPCRIPLLLLWERRRCVNESCRFLVGFEPRRLRCCSFLLACLVRVLMSSLSLSASNFTPNEILSCDELVGITREEGHTGVFFVCLCEPFLLRHLRGFIIVGRVFSQSFPSPTFP